MAMIYNINGNVKDNTGHAFNWNGMEDFFKKTGSYILAYNKEIETSRKILNEALSDIRRKMEKAGACGNIMPTPFLATYYGKPISMLYDGITFKNVYSICCSKPEDDNDYGYIGKLEVKKTINTLTFEKSAAYSTILYRFNKKNGIYERYQEADRQPTGYYGWIPVSVNEAMEITDRQMADIEEHKYLWLVYDELKNINDGIVTDEAWKQTISRNSEILEILNDPVADRTLKPMINTKEEKKGQIYLVPSHASGLAVSYDNGSYRLHIYGPENDSMFIDHIVGSFSKNKNRVINFICHNLNRAFYPGNTYVLPISNEKVIIVDGIKEFSDIDFDETKKNTDYNEDEMAIIEILESYAAMTEIVRNSTGSA